MALTSDELLRDRRLLRRRGGLAPEALEKLFEELPDVADKAELVDAPVAKPPEGSPGSSGDPGASDPSIA